MPLSQRVKIIGQGYKPLEWQRKFHQSKARFRAVIGGFGCGKTHLGAREALKITQLYPGSYGLIGRLTSTALKDTTQKKFFEVFPAELIHHWNKTENHLWVKTGVPGLYSEIVFRHLDDPGQFGSADLDWFWIDEAHEPDGSEVPEDVWTTLQARIQRGSRGPYVGWVTSNSGGKDWIYNWFFDNEAKIDPDEYWGITVRSEENAQHLEPGYLERLNKFPKAWVARFLHASFDAFEGQIYTHFDEKVHVIDRLALPEGWRLWPGEAGFDFGIASPTVVAYSRISPDGRIYIVDEFYEAEANVAKVVAHMRTRGYRRVWADPSTRQRALSQSANGQVIKLTVADHFARFGVSLDPAHNDLSDGITAVTQALILDHTGKPKLYITDNCTRLIKSISNYRWMASKPGEEFNEKPSKKDNHGADAIRYVVISQPLYRRLNPLRPVRKTKVSGWDPDKMHPSYLEDLDAEKNPDLKDYFMGVSDDW